MGSITGDVYNSRRDVTVLVTGFGPFQERFPINPSFEITRLLPDILPRTVADGRRIRIIAYAAPIRVSYDEVHKLVPVLHETLRGVVDLVLHIGMASGRDHYTAEMYGHRDGYSKNKDLDGETLLPDDGIVHFGDCPAMMTTALECEELLRRWHASLSTVPINSPAFGADCQLSDDAGNYLCDYIYFNSLAWFGRRNGKFDGGKASDRPVMFLHVPAESDPLLLERGRDVTIALIEAMAETWAASERMTRMAA